MICNIPSSREDLTLAWLQDALKAEPFEIISFSWNDTEGPVGGGVGALSNLERISVKILKDGEKQTLSLIIKTPPTNNEGLRSFVLSEGFCQREFKMYAQLFPAWQRFYESRGTAKQYQFRYPKCYYAAEEGEGMDYRMIVILEDLVASGFSSFPDGYKKGLRWSQARKVVREMAIFHAVGVAYQMENRRNDYQSSEYDWLFKQSKNQEAVESFLRSGIDATCTMLRKHPDVPTGLISDLEGFHDVERLQALSIPEGDKLGTITHQDLHVYNLMHTNDRVAFLDFQGCSYSSPMTDLSFFLLLCCDPSLFTNKLSLVQRYYQKQFNSAIKSMTDEPFRYSMQRIQSDYASSIFISVIHIIMGSLVWSLGDDDTEERYKLALMDSYKRSGCRLGLEKVHDFVDCFEQEIKEWEE